MVRRHAGTYLDGELDPTTQLEFEEHLDGCAECQECVAFEVAFRERVHEALGDVQAPASLKQRVLLDLDEAEVQHKRSGALIRIWSPFSKADDSGRGRFSRGSILAAAAAALLLFGGSAIGLGGSGTAGVDSAGLGLGGSSLLEDVVRLHSSALPSDVPEARQETVARYFQGKVRFPVRPMRFDCGNVRLVGARLSNIRDRRAAALYYDANGQRVTMVVLDSPPPALFSGAARVLARGHEVYYRDVHGYTVPIRRQHGLTYLFTGDLARPALLDLVASAHVGR
ncbi:MAG: hypothetical protein GXP55_08000 [Deltaproteobacteria bacterium]|nr:hypothetical protein [Deltaproteobacteria bacterium]